MGLFKGSLPVCPSNRHCSQWATTYLKYCLCSVRDGVSLSLGLVSVMSWGVAEVPQIITNYNEKSAEGLSIAFLMTWIVGDFFNLFGCMLEPATLPTQYYMAVLYTVTTLILTSQTIYYGHIYHRLKSHRRGQKGPMLHQTKTVDTRKHTDSDVCEKQVKLGDGVLPSSPIPVAVPALPRSGSHGRELYCMSARYMSKSRTPAVGSYLAHSRGYARTSISVHDPQSLEESLLHGIVSAQSAPPLNTKSMFCVVSAVIFFLNTYGLHISENNRFNMVLEKPSVGVVIPIGRKLLQDSGGLLMIQGVEGNVGIGTFLGWGMAAIYMGGRLPQICLNIRKGNVEGLNPLMFVFALVGNATYLASILVSSLNWSKLRPNLPWLVEGGGCILLDCFFVHGPYGIQLLDYKEISALKQQVFLILLSGFLIILIQFIYFCYLKPNAAKSKHGDFTVA